MYYTYNDIGQLDTLTAPGSKLWDYTYDTGNRLARVDIPNGMHTEYTYDTSGRQDSIHHKDGATVKQGFDYTFDDGGNITRIDHEDGSYWEYDYDGRERLIDAIRGNHATPTILATYEYTYDPGRTLASEATVLAGIGDSTIELEGGLTLSSQRLVHTIESEGGGRVILAEGGDPDAAAFLNTAVSSRASQPVAPWRRVVFQAIPDVGYFPQYPLESLVIFGNMYRFLHDSYSPVGETIAFPKMYELTLIALPKGGGNPECVGYIKAQEAKKYYLPGEEVQLTAIEQPGYTFTGWRGGAWGWLPDESEEDSVPIEWLAASSIIIKMEHTYTVIAEYCKCTHEGATDNGTLVGGLGYVLCPKDWNATDGIATKTWAATTGGARSTSTRSYSMPRKRGISNFQMSTVTMLSLMI